MVTLSAIAVISDVRNNDEKPLLGPGHLPDIEERYAAWLSQRVPREALERLNSLPLTASVVDGRVLAAHGTPASPWKNLLWRLEGNGLVPRADTEVLADLEGLHEDVEVVVVGHTHYQGVLRVGGRMLVNVGPVSWQKDGDPRARWALLQRGTGDWKVRQQRVTYDWNAAARAVMANEPVFHLEADAHLFGVDQPIRMIAEEPSS